MCRMSFFILVVAMTTACCGSGSQEHSLFFILCFILTAAKSRIVGVPEDLRSAVTQMSSFSDSSEEGVCYTAMSESLYIKKLRDSPLLENYYTYGWLWLPEGWFMVVIGRLKCACILCLYPEAISPGKCFGKAGSVEFYRIYFCPHLPICGA